MQVSDSGLKGLQKSADDAKVSDLPASEFMSSNVLVLQKDTKIFSAILSLRNHGISGAPIVDGRQRLIGMVSEYDLLLQAAVKDLAAPIEFQKTVKFIHPETTLREVLVILYKQKFRRLPVVDKRGQVLGIVSRMDVLSRLIEPKKKKS